MIFVFGGAYSGKGEYVKSKLGVSEITPYDAPYEELKKAKAVPGEMQQLVLKKADLQDAKASDPIVVKLEEASHGNS